LGRFLLKETLGHRAVYTGIRSRRRREATGLPLSS
jgi:hypothetical protein